MSWKEVTVVENRKRFIELWESEDSPGVAALCREFEISRKTAYKWIDRYEVDGPDGLLDLSRAPHYHPNAIDPQMELLVIQARGKYPSWGAKKILPWLRESYPRTKHWPSLSGISAILDRNQLVRSRKRRRLVPAFQGCLTNAQQPNDLWTIDHKGWWLAGNGDKCEPFTVADQQSRFLIRCTLCAGKGFEYVSPVLQAAFREFGLPKVIRSDNGPPFASRAPLGLSPLSVWFVRLGIVHERIEPGKPQQNGCHERMHRTMVGDCRGVGFSLRQEQQRLNAWRQEFNYERPHEALDFDTPAVRYSCSERQMPRRLGQVAYASATEVRKVDCSGSFKWRGRHVFLTEALANQRLGFKALDKDGSWQVLLDQMNLGCFNEQLYQMDWAKEMSLQPD